MPSEFNKKKFKMKATDDSNHKTLQIEKIKTDIYNIRQVLDMMDFLVDREQYDRLNSYMPEFKTFVLSLDKHTK